MERLFLIAVSLLACVPAASAHAGDWPQFRYDAGRTAASPCDLPPELVLRWTRAFPAPRPAFPHELRLAYDASYEPVVLGRRMFVPSMAADSVTALDIETGAELWLFIAGGPVRFAPAARAGKVYFVSDDGYLYCADAATGALHWKLRGLPADRRVRKVLGHGRLISLWPARGGPVLADGVVYFAAGLWPTEGVFVHAVDAETGDAVWSNTDSDRIVDSNWDHGVGFHSGLTPQGYLAIIGDRLIVPCGAQLPAFLDLKTGSLETYTMGWGGRLGLPKGCWFVAGIGNYLSHAGDLYDITRPSEERLAQIEPGQIDYKPMLYPGGWTRLDIERANQRELDSFRQPVLTPEVIYEGGGSILARDLTEVALREWTEATLPPHRAKDEIPDTIGGVFRRLWQMPSKLDLHIKAGSRLYAGGPGIVEAIDAAGPEPKIVWRADIEGTPHRMLAAGGQLFVVTTEGTILAFGAPRTGEAGDAGRAGEAGRAAEAGETRQAGQVAEPGQAAEAGVAGEAQVAGQAGPPGEAVVHAAAGTPRPSADAWTSRAAAILDATGARSGYALVLGIDRGRLVDELVRQSDLHVVAVDADAGKVAGLRERLYRSGLYGARASVLAGDPLTCPFPPYMASLVVSETPGDLGRGAEDELARAAFHALRPYGGAACAWGALADRGRIEEIVDRDAFPGARVRGAGAFVLLVRAGPLPGAADWSHAEADAAGTGASSDALRSPAAVLWFDAARRWHKYPGQVQVRIAGGRVIILEDGLLQATDVYTGRMLWETELSDTPSDRARLRHSLHRQWGPPTRLSPSTAFVAVEDAIYLGDGPGCLVFDPATGGPRGRIDLPEDLDAPWTNLRLCGDYLLGTSGRHVFCMDRRTGAPVWRCEAARASLYLVAGGGKVFCSELAQPQRGEDDTADGSIFALDLTTGERLWQRPGGAWLRYSPSLDIVVTPAAFYRGGTGDPLPRHSDAPQTRLVVTGGGLPKAGLPGIIAGRRLLTGSDDTLVLHEIPSARRIGEPLEWFRRGCTGTRASTNLLTTRYRGNSAWIDLESLRITPFLGVRPGCSVNNNLYPADGVMNLPNLTGGCTCNYAPASLACVPAEAVTRVGAE